MRWQDAPIVEEQNQPAWMSAPVVDVMTQAANRASSYISDLTKGPFQQSDLESMVDDPEWAKQNIAALPEGQREAGVNQINNAINMKKAYDVANTSYAKDIALSVPSGVARGIAGMAALPNLVERGGRWIAGNESPAKSPSYEQLVNEEERLLGTKLYEPKTVPGEFANAVGEFVPGLPLGGTGSIGRRAVTNVVAPAVVSETAGQVTKGTRVEPWARLAGALAGGIGAETAFAKGRLSPAAVQRNEIIQAAANQGVELPRGSVSTAPGVQAVTAKLAGLPVMGTPISRASTEAINQLESARARVGTGNVYDAGATAKERIADWIGNKSDDIQSRMYDNVDASIDPNFTRPLTSTKDLVDALRKQASESTSTSSNSAINLVDEALKRPEGLSYEGLKNLRTDVGSRISGKITPEPGTSQPALKRLYGALTDDLRQTVKEGGGDAGLNAWEKANRISSMVADKRDSLAKIIGADGAASENAVYARIKKLASTGASGDVSRLSEVKKTLGSEAWGEFRGAVVDGMGVGRDGKFSASNFVTEYRKLSPEAKDVMFGSLKSDLDDIAQVSSYAENLYKMGNPSGSAGGVAVGAGVSKVFSDPLSVLGSLVGGRTISSWLARPAKVKAMSKWLKIADGVRNGSVNPAVLTNATKELTSEDQSGMDGVERLKNAITSRSMQGL